MVNPNIKGLLVACFCLSVHSAPSLSIFPFLEDVIEYSDLKMPPPNEMYRGNNNGPAQVLPPNEMYRGNNNGPAQVLPPNEMYGGNNNGPEQVLPPNEIYGGNNNGPAPPHPGNWKAEQEIGKQIARLIVEKEKDKLKYFSTELMKQLNVFFPRGNQTTFNQPAEILYGITNHLCEVINESYMENFINPIYCDNQYPMDEQSKRKRELADPRIPSFEERRLRALGLKAKMKSQMWG